MFTYRTTNYSSACSAFVFLYPKLNCSGFAPSLDEWWCDRWPIVPTFLLLLFTTEMRLPRCGSVHLDVCLIDQSTSLPSGLKQTLLLYPSNMVDTPTCDVIRGRFFKTACKANHTHTWWHVMRPLRKPSQKRRQALFQCRERSEIHTLCF